MIEAILLATNNYCQFHFNNKWNEYPCTVVENRITLGDTTYTLNDGIVCSDQGVCEEVKVKRVRNNVFGPMVTVTGQTFSIHFMDKK